MTLMTVTHTNDETEKAFIYIGSINIYIFNVCLWLTGTHYKLFVLFWVFFFTKYGVLFLNYVTCGFFKMQFCFTQSFQRLFSTSRLSFVLFLAKLKVAPFFKGLSVHIVSTNCSLLYWHIVDLYHPVWGRKYTINHLFLTALCAVSDLKAWHV